jgi:hypothetical protein
VGGSCLQENVMSRIKPHEHWPIPRKVFLEGKTDELESICQTQTDLIHSLRRKIEELSNSVYDANTDRFIYIGR